MVLGVPEGRDGHDIGLAWSVNEVLREDDKVSYFRSSVFSVMAFIYNAFLENRPSVHRSPPANHPKSPDGSLESQSISLPSSYSV